MLMAVAVVAIVVARSGEKQPGAANPAGAGGSPTPAAAAGTPTPSVTAPPSPTEQPSTPGSSTAPAPSASAASLEPGATEAPGPSALPSPTRTYTVRSGDTLSAIAARFGTTVKVIQQLNGIADASLIRVGQVLALP